MKALTIVREQIERLYYPDQVPIETRRKLVRVAKRAAKRGENARRAVCEALRK